MHRNSFVYGPPVYGEKFFGRQRELNLLWSRLINARQPGSCSVVGETRIGKSSLKEQFLKQLHESHRDNVIAISLSVDSDFKTGKTEDFYRQLFAIVAEEVSAINGIDQLSLARAGEMGARWHQMIRSFKKFLGSLQAAGKLLLVVLDEFDYMDKQFEFDPQGWNVLRDIAYSPESPLVYLTLSRRPLTDIESDLRISSNFANIFGEPIRLGRLSHEETLSLVIEPVKQQGFTWPQHIPENIYALTGGHPYLSQLVCFHLFEMIFRKEPLADLTLDDLENQFADEFYSLFSKLKERLERKNAFTTLLRVTYNAPVEAESQVLEELVRLGYLDDLDDGSYKPFSPLFERYLRSFRFTEDLWPLLSKTEKALRRMVEQRYREQFRDDWLGVIAKKNKLPNQPLGQDLSIVDNWQKEQQKELKSSAVEDAANLSLLDYSYIGELWQLIYQQKPLFLDFVGNGQQRSQVESAMANLIAVRNPSAHFRPVKSEAAVKTHLSCQFLLGIIPNEYV